MTMKSLLTTSAVLAAIAAAPGCGDLQNNIHISVDRVAYTPDGTLVVFTTDGLFLFDDPSLATEKGRIPLGLPSPDASSSYVYSLSSDGTTAAVAYSFVSNDQIVLDTTVALYHVPDGEPLRTLQIAGVLSAFYPQTAGGLALSPHGDLLAVLAADANDAYRSHLNVVDAATGTTAWVATGEISMPVWSPDGGTVYATDGSLFVADPAAQPYVLEAFDAATGTQKWSRPWSMWPRATAIVADGTLLAGVGDEMPDASPQCPNPGDCPSVYPFWSAADGTRATQLPGVPGGWSFLGGDLRSILRCSTTDDVCATVYGNAGPGAGDPRSFSVRIYRPDGAVVATVSIDGFTFNVDVALSPDGQYLAVVAQLADWNVRVYRIADGALVGERKFSREVL